MYEPRHWNCTFLQFSRICQKPWTASKQAFGFWMWESFVLGFWPKITSFCPEVHVSWINHPMSNDRQTGSMELYKIFWLWSDSTLSWSLQSGSCHGFHSQPHEVSAPSAPNPPSQAAASIRLTRDWKSYIPRVQVARRHWHHLGTDSHFLSTKTFSFPEK